MLKYLGFIVSLILTIILFKTGNWTLGILGGLVFLTTIILILKDFENPEISFEIKGLVIKNDIKLTKERQNIIKEFLKFMENSQKFEPYNGISSIKEAREKGGVYFVDNRFKNVFECVDEPTNEYDPNAIKVLIKNFGHIGYIGKEKTEFYRELLKNSNQEIKEITLHIIGGKLKGDGYQKTHYFNANIIITKKSKFELNKQKIKK